MTPKASNNARSSNTVGELVHENGNGTPQDSIDINKAGITRGGTVSASAAIAFPAVATRARNHDTAARAAATPKARPKAAAANSDNNINNGTPKDSINNKNIMGPRKLAVPILVVDLFKLGPWYRRGARNLVKMEPRRLAVL